MGDSSATKIPRSPFQQREISPLSHRQWVGERTDELQAVKQDFATWIADIGTNEDLFKKHVYNNDNLDQVDLWEHRARLYRLLAIGDYLKLEFVRVSALLDKAEALKSHIGLIEQQHKELFSTLLAWHGPREMQKDIPESFKTGMEQAAAGNLLEFKAE
jgi:hypothetical protein